MSLANLRGKLLLSLLLGLLVVLALSLYADLPKLLRALGSFYWPYLPLVLGLTLVNYALRFLKWEYYLRQIGVVGLTKRDSFLVFFSGLSMVVTPGKVGEWLKSYLLKEVSGTPFARSAPIIIAERLSDGVAMLFLAAGGLIVFRVAWQLLLLVLLLALTIVVLSQYRPLALAILSFGERLPILAARVHPLRQFYESSYTLFSPRNLAVAVSIGFVSWSAECVAFYFVLGGLGMQGGWLLLLQATFILATTSLGGSIFLAPGGLGIAEGGIVGLLQLLLGAPKELAAAAALIIRLGTLWFGVALGTLTLFIFLRRMRYKAVALEQEPS